MKINSVFSSPKKIVHAPSEIARLENLMIEADWNGHENLRRLYKSQIENMREHMAIEDSEYYPLF